MAPFATDPGMLGMGIQAPINANPQEGNVLLAQVSRCLSHPRTPHLLETLNIKPRLIAHLQQTLWSLQHCRCEIEMALAARGYVFSAMF